MSETPYRAAARSYFGAGWSPIPLPTEEKSPPPNQFAGKPQMFTGVGGVYVTEQHLKVWLGIKGRAQAGKLSFAPGNIALRLPPGIIAVDVDAYGEKKGGETLAKAEEEWGALPPTWVSTSKTDGVSGIRLFRVPPGLKWPGELPQGKGVELLRWDHRFMIVAPSIHDKTKLPYRWYREMEVEENGETIVKMVLSEEEFPDAPPEDGVDPESGLPSDLLLDLKAGGEGYIPWLPTEWVEGLTQGREFAADEVDETLDGAKLNAWLAERNAPESPCAHMRKMQTRWAVSVQKAADDGGAHDEMRDAIWGALNDAKAGHSGIVKVLGHMRNVFLKAVDGRRPDEGAAKSEWARAVLRGGQKVTADDNEPEEDDPCDSVGSRPGKLGKQRKSGSGSGSSGSGRGSAGSRGTSMEDPGPIGSRDVEECNEKGNANRLVRVFNGRARWVEAYGSWYLWSGDEGVWRADDTRQVDRWVVKAIDAISEEVAFLKNDEDGEKQIKAFKAHQKSSYAQGNRNAMKDMAKGRKGIMIPADRLDADPALLCVGNGVVELGAVNATGEIILKPHSPEHYFTMRTTMAFRPGAWAPGGKGMWSEFLERFLPDEEVREWLQRLVGYSLLGKNPARLLLVLKGKTSTGKSTFAEAIRTVLGDYGALMTASMLRDNADDKPRPDILAALARRVVVAEELGAAQHLHADQIKRLTGSTPVTARGMRSNTYITRVPAFTPWIVCNNVPTIEGADNALKRRILVVPFNVQIKQQDEDINYFDRLIEEAGEEILSWCLQGHAVYLENPNLFDVPAGALGAATEFAEGMNEFQAWLTSQTDTGEGYCEIPRRLYEAYVDWCNENGIKERDQMSNTAFGRKLNDIDIVKARRTIEGKQIDVRLGIRLTGGTVRELS